MDLEQRHLSEEWIEQYLLGAIVVDSSQDKYIDRNTFYQVMRYIRQIRASHNRVRLKHLCSIFSVMFNT